jgi:beta-mannosidase
VARVISCSASTIDSLADGWECARTAQGTVVSPTELTDDLTWLPASVPGTFAAALRDGGHWDGQSPLELDQSDIWYRTRFRGGGEETLCFEGLATIADVWLNGEHVLRSENMFLPRQITVRTQPTNDLHICFRSLAVWLQAQRGRARWRTRLATPATLRFARTTLLGRMPGWCPTIHPVGPWRPLLRKQRVHDFEVQSISAQASVSGSDGRLELQCSLAGDVPETMEAVAEIGGSFGRLTQVAPGQFAGEVTVPKVALWWPHTHGAPRLHQATLRLGDVVCDIGRVGFRQIAIDRCDDGRGFSLCVNGEAIFCRGACWTTPDIVALPSDTASYRPWLEAMRDAGLNMVRIGGTMVYEAAAFYALCDELGLLVWQDAMLANFDYPATAEFRASVVAELEGFLDSTQLNASLAVVCGGSEVLQQAAMFGLASDRIDDSLYTTVIPEAVRRVRPDVAYVINSPSGGDLPFQSDTGVAHYYGVGAYLRPFDDARRAGVRFASECLAIANVPCSRTVEELRVSTTTDPRWKQAVPRDPGAGWDFEDVRDHYLAMLFRVDPLHLRYADFARYLQLSSAVSCVLIEEVFAEWRRVGSSCHGGLIWQWQDVVPGAGWGIMDSLGRRKPAWYALQRASRSRQIVLTDEGLNGLAVHVVNEADQPLDAVLRLACFKDGSTPVREAEQPVVLAPRGALRLASSALLPGFFDITYAYRFGPRPHHATIATLHDRASGTLIADSCHFPDTAALQPHDLGLEAAVERDETGWWLRVQARHVAQFLHVEDEAFVPAENWLHLHPGRERRIALRPGADQTAAPRGEIRAVNMDRVVHYAGSA